MSGGLVVLLDLNYTLVCNSEEKNRRFAEQIRGERYRAWLIDLCRPHRTILMTARPVRHAAETLASLLEKNRWQPAEWHFNARNLPPPASKRLALEESVFPAHGRPESGTRYLALESNPRSRAMYAGRGIPALRWEDVQGLTALPGAEDAP
jgi:hypothetical protein